MLSKSQKRVVFGAAVLVLVVLFVMPAINVNRFRLSVARSLSQVLGREVTIQDISIQTFPQPGLLMHNVVIGDDPTISAEPMLRADEVLATLRFSSLWRGRLEVSALKFKYPSLNLVRANDGRWNLESLLERARESPSAPTAKTRPESRLRFPYIESTGGRINLKIGNEKKAFALNDADFAVWLASEDEWRMRLEARPIRTDANLSDTGTIKVEGSWRRAPQLHETPLYVRFWWDYGQLGQVTHLIDGRDRGWRGAVHISGTVSGKPEELAIKADAKVEDFRRYDILTGDSVSLEVHCSSDYDFTAKQVRDLACQMPAGGGVVLARGTYDFVPQPRIDLTLTAENIPMQYLATLARHAKRDLPADMNLTGMASAAFAVRGDYGHRQWAGNGEVSRVEIRSTVLHTPLVLAPSRWSLGGPGSEEPVTVRRGKKKRAIAQTELAPPKSLAWRLEPIAVKLGESSPATLAGWFSRDGYYTELQGDADLGRVFEVAKLAGLPTPASDVSGSAKGKVEISGEWAGFVPATITADAQLKNVSARFSGVATPLRISAAHFLATKDALIVSKGVGAFAGVHSALEFSARWPQHCTAAQSVDPLTCGVEFEISADTLDLDEINSLLNPKAQKRPWYAALANTVIGSQRTKFPEIYARGKIAAAKLEVKSVTASRFSSTVTIVPSGFSLTDITANVFGGQYSGELHCDFGATAPAYTSEGKLAGAAMTDIAAVMKDPWAAGTANINYRGQLSGWSADELLSSATASANFVWQNGVLPHVELDGAGKPLQFKIFKGTLGLYDGTLSLKDAVLTTSKTPSSSGIYLVSGTASLGRRLELKLTRDATHPGYSITGTLEKPAIAPLRVSASQSNLSESSNR